MCHCRQRPLRKVSQLQFCQRVGCLTLIGNTLDEELRSIGLVEHVLSFDDDGVDVRERGGYEERGCH